MPSVFLLPALPPFPLSRLFRIFSQLFTRYSLLSTSFCLLLTAYCLSLSRFTSFPTLSCLLSTCYILFLTPYVYCFLLTVLLHTPYCLFLSRLTSRYESIPTFHAFPASYLLLTPYFSVLVLNSPLSIYFMNLIVSG